jgi:hypothetical protein
MANLLSSRFVIASFFALALLSAAARAGEYQDDRLGFKIQIPREWAPIAQKVDERWIVAKYLSNKNTFYTDETHGYTVDHKPEMQIIAFVKEAVQQERTVLRQTIGKDGEKKIKADIDVHYKDYKDFMAKRYTGGGYFVDSEKEIQVGDIPVTHVEFKVERMSREGPKRILTWVYHLPDVDVAVQFECLENAYSKLADDFERSLRSFKVTPRSGGKLFEASTPGRKLSLLDLEEMSVEERKTHRLAMERAAHEKASAAPPEGWTAKKIGRFLVINHVDDKYAKVVAEQAECVWQWLDENFAFFGQNEYVRAPILRICKDLDEARTFYKAGDWVWNNLEVVTFKDYGGSAGFMMEWLNRRVAEIWFEDRDRNLYWALPHWLSHGLDEILGMTRCKNGKVDFRTDFWNRDEVRQAVRDGKNTPARDLMMMEGEAFYTDYLHRQEAASLVGFFLTGAASKNKKTRDVLTDYLKNLKLVVDAIDAEEEQSGKKALIPKTEEEEEEHFKKKRNEWKEKEKRIMEEAWQRTFGSWSDKDWEQFEQLYKKAIS